MNHFVERFNLSSFHQDEGLLGWDVDLNEDGTVAVVSAFGLARVIVFSRRSISDPWGVPASLSIDTMRDGGSANVFEYGYTSKVSPDGNTVAVGCRKCARGGEQSPTGAVFLFLKEGVIGNLWSDPLKLESPEPSADSNFGETLAITRGHLAVCAPSESTTAPNSGACFLFRGEGLDFAFSQKISPPEPRPNLFFGAGSVEFSPDSQALAISSIHADPRSTSANDNLGEVLVFHFVAPIWDLTWRLEPVGVGLSSGLEYGTSLSLSSMQDWGMTVVVGAEAYSDPSPLLNDTGIIYAHLRRQWGDNGGSGIVLRAPNLETEHGMKLGADVAINSHGNISMSCAPGKTVNGKPNAGECYLWLRNPPSGTEWQLSAFPIDLGEHERGGNRLSRVAMNSDGSYVLIGAAQSLNSAGLRSGNVFGVCLSETCMSPTPAPSPAPPVITAPSSSSTPILFSSSLFASYSSFISSTSSLFADSSFAFSSASLSSDFLSSPTMLAALIGAGSGLFLTVIIIAIVCVSQKRKQKQRAATRNQVKLHQIEATSRNRSSGRSSNSSRRHSVSHSRSSSRSKINHSSMGYANVSEALRVRDEGSSSSTKYSAMPLNSAYSSITPTTNYSVMPSSSSASSGYETNPIGFAD